MEANTHAARVDRLARYRAVKQGQPLDQARRWAETLSPTESAELVALVELVEARQAEQIAAAADQEAEHARRRRDVGELGGRFRARLDEIADRLRAEAAEARPEDLPEELPPPVPAGVPKPGAVRKRRPSRSQAKDNSADGQATSAGPGTAAAADGAPRAA